MSTLCKLVANVKCKVGRDVVSDECDAFNQMTQGAEVRVVNTPPPAQPLPQTTPSSTTTTSHHRHPWRHQTRRHVIDQTVVRRTCGATQPCKHMLFQYLRYAFL